MKHEVLKLKDLNKKIKSEAILRSYIPDNFDEFSKGRKRKCVLVFPGGGYEFVSDRENEPIALKLISEDIAVFTLTYSLMVVFFLIQLFILEKTILLMVI